jgi:hypothetical protein
MLSSCCLLILVPFSSFIWTFSFLCLYAHSAQFRFYFQQFLFTVGLSSASFFFPVYLTISLSDRSQAIHSVRSFYLHSLASRVLKSSVLKLACWDFQWIPTCYFGNKTLISYSIAVLLNPTDLLMLFRSRSVVTVLACIWQSWEFSVNVVVVVCESLMLLSNCSNFAEGFGDSNLCKCH